MADARITAGCRSASNVQRDHPNDGRNKRSNFQAYDRFDRHLCSVVSRPADRMPALGRMDVRRFTNGKGSGPPGAAKYAPKPAQALADILEKNEGAKH